MRGLPAKVSLIVPVYNVENYLRRCLESCREQTLNDLEFIFVDDGSTDRSGEILENYMEEDSRATVIHKANGGLSSARNAGLDAASSQWVMFLDSDDYLEPTACERIWIESEEAPTDIIAFGTNYFPEYPVPADADWLNHNLHPRTIRYHKFHPEILFDEPGGSPYACRQAFSLELLNQYNLRFNEDVKFGEDMLFQLKVFPRAKEFSFIADNLYHYRLGRVGSLMDIAERNPSEKLHWHIEIMDRAITEWEGLGLLDKYASDLLNWSVDYVINNTYRSTVASKKELLSTFYEVLEKHHLMQELKKITMDRKILLNKLKQES